MVQSGYKLMILVSIPSFEEGGGQRDEPPVLWNTTFSKGDDIKNRKPCILSGKVGVRRNVLGSVCGVTYWTSSTSLTQLWHVIAPNQFLMNNLRY